eukprot:465668_1
MLQLPNYIDLMFKRHMCNPEITLNFIELLHNYPWMDSLFIKHNKYTDTKTLNIANICKLFCHSDKIVFIMPEDYVFSSIECTSFVKQDLLEIAVNTINVIISFVWPLKMPNTNIGRMALYDNELTRNHFAPNVKQNSVTFSATSNQNAINNAFFKQIDTETEDVHFMPHQYSASTSTGIYGSNLYYDYCIQNKMNNTLNNDNNKKQKPHIWVRKRWRHGSKVNVYSRTAKQWATGTVERQFQDDEGEWQNYKKYMEPLNIIL